MGAARAHAHVLAGARRALGRALRAGRVRLRGGRERDRRLRAGADGGAPSQVDDGARRLLGRRRGVGMPIDDSWSRDSGPIFVIAARPPRAASTSASTPGARSSCPTTRTPSSPRRVLEHLGEERRDAPRPRARGRLDRGRRRGHADHDRAVPAAPARNPSLERAEIEARLRAELGVERVVWLGPGPARGHRHRRPRRQHLRGRRARAACCCRPCADPANPNYENCRRTRERLRAAGIEVVELRAPALRGPRTPSCPTSTSTSATAP